MSQRRLQGNGNGNGNGNAAAPPPPPPPYYCPTPIDFVLVLDDSGSILEAVDDLKEFAKAVVSGFRLGANEGRFAVVTFATSATLQQEFSIDRTEIEAAIDKLKGDGATSISDGLTMAQGVFEGVVDGVAVGGARQGAPRVVLLVSDGDQTKESEDCLELNPVLGLVDDVTRCRAAAIAASTPLKAAGATVFSWGFAKVNLATLQGIASDPDKALLTGTVQELQNFVNQLIVDACVSPNPSTPPPLPKLPPSPPPLPLLPPLPSPLPPQSPPLPPAPPNPPFSPPAPPAFPPTLPPPALPPLDINATASPLSGGGDDEFPFALLFLPLLLLLLLPLALAAVKKRKRGTATTSAKKRVENPSFSDVGETEAARRRGDEEESARSTLSELPTQADPDLGGRGRAITHEDGLYAAMTAATSPKNNSPRNNSPRNNSPSSRSSTSIVLEKIVW